MSATLADDSVFISAVGLHRDDIKRIIVPDNANDIGDRLFLFPRHLNSEIKNEEIRDKLFLISQKHNVVVIVPSFERAKFWDPHVERTVTKDTIDAVVAKLKATHLGLVVMVNRYDGVDLPDNACRVLVIDGLPPLRNEKDKYIQSINPSSRILVKEQIQRIEQGMGRGVRSNSDSCCIVLMGDNLADVLLRNNGVCTTGVHGQFLPLCGGGLPASGLCPDGRRANRRWSAVYAHAVPSEIREYGRE